MDGSHHRPALDSKDNQRNPVPTLQEEAMIRQLKSSWKQTVLGVHGEDARHLGSEIHHVRGYQGGVTGILPRATSF